MFVTSLVYIWLYWGTLFLTLWSGVLRGKLVVRQASQEISRRHRIQSLITEFTETWQWFVSRADESNPYTENIFYKELF